MKRTERISSMEEILDKTLEMIKEMDSALEKYKALQPEIEELNRYYGSREWHGDLKADEEGKLPADLKRGVLSEDGIYDALTDNRRLAEEMREIVQEFNKEN